MTRARALVALIVVLAVAVATRADRVVRADAPVLHHGSIQGAEFLISMPAAWNGGLVMFAHGYEGEGPGAGRILTPPLHRHLEARGYAWATSGYRSLGYRPDWFVADTLALRAHLIARFGRPRWTIVHGQSMGGHVAVAALELHPDVFQGALIECGVVDGIGLIDWLYAHAAAVEYFSRVPLLEAVRRQSFDGLVNGPWLDVVAAPGFDSVLKHLMGGELPLRREGLRQRHATTRSPDAPAAHEFARHASTLHIRYRIDPGLGVDEATLNRDIRRVTPEPGARSREANPYFAELTGKIRVPLMTIHETGDVRVPFRLQQDYRRRTQAAGTSHWLVQRAIRAASHCAFDAAVRPRAFDDLVAWVERGVVPAGDDVLAPDVAALGRR